MAAALSLLTLLVAVAFYTLLERKFLGYLMLRRGPNKPSALGLPTPFADALKLVTKPFCTPFKSVPRRIGFACLLYFSVPSLCWTQVPVPTPVWDWQHTVLSVLIWLSLAVFALLAAGWGSNSKYSVLGGTRCIAQSISYEVCLTTLLLAFCLSSSLSLFTTSPPTGLLLYAHLIVVLFLIALAETNRSPFDFAEGESELVSGYNVEYRGPGFVLLFLSEYLAILFMSALCSCLSSPGCRLVHLALTLLFSCLFLWTRGTLPRFRYDQLMALCWTSLLPICLSSFSLLLLFYT